MIPDNVEKIIMTKEDYDRNVEQLLVDKCKAEQEIERLNNKVEELMTLYTTERNVKEDYKTIIKEVRECVETAISEDYYDGEIYKIKKILDKEMIKNEYST